MVPDPASLEGLKIDRDAAPRPRRWPWVTAAVLLTMVVLAAGGWWLARPAVAAVNTAVATEVRLDGQPQRTVLNASGYVTARRQATVSSKVTGKVTEVLIEEGLQVEEGQVLARLDDTNVSASFRLAEARLGAAEAALEETGVRIREAELDYSRVGSLVREQVASQAELDRAQAELDSQRARLDVQRREVQVAERELALWRQQLDDTVIRAPFAGVIVTKNAQPGEMISPAAAGGGFTRTGIGTIVDMASLEIEVDVNEAYINRITADQPVEAVLDAYPDWTIPAHVIAIIPTADRQRATVQVRIGFESLDPRILPDMGVKVAFMEPEDTDAGAGDQAAGVGVLVPARAVRKSDGSEVVFVVDGERVERRAVRARQAEDGTVLVEAGLTAGEVVVVDGPAELADGDKIRPREMS